VSKKKTTIDIEILATIAVYIIVTVFTFFMGSAILVLVWDWTATAMFHAPSAPYTAGMGITLLLSMVEVAKQIKKDRK
jgi:hypothetical protein